MNLKELIKNLIVIKFIPKGSYETTNPDAIHLTPELFIFKNWYGRDVPKEKIKSISYRGKKIWERK